MAPFQRLVLLATLASLAAGCGATGQRATVRPAAELRAAGADELIVRYRPGARPGRLPIAPLRRIPALSAVVIPASAPEAELAELSSDPDVLGVTANGALGCGPAPRPEPIAEPGKGSDPYLPHQWALAKIGAPAAWQAGELGAGVTVALLGTGVDGRHADLAGRVEAGPDLVNGDGDPSDDHGTGTLAAGVVAAGRGDGVGIVGVAPAARLLAVKVLGANGQGREDHAAAGLVQAVDMGANVILAGFWGKQDFPLLRDAIDYAVRRGVLVVAPMGDENWMQPAFPAGHRHVMAVAATDPGDARWWNSNYGRHCSVAAPGFQVLSTFPGQRWTYATGTVTAAAHVAGQAALLLAADAGLDVERARRRIEATAKDIGSWGHDQNFGHGRIDVTKALGLR